MTLNATGKLSLGGKTIGESIQLELQSTYGTGGTNTISMGDSAARTLAKKSSGMIKMSDFYGKSSVITVSAPSDTILYNVDVRQSLVDAGWDQNIPAVYTIPATTYITSSTTTSPALTVSGSFPNGITIVNNGYILGRGGNGGGSGGGWGTSGGTAMYITTNCKIDNKNIIAGGGGGGGAGKTGDNYSSGGGGGGAPYGVNGGSSYYSGGTAATLTTAGIADMNLNPPYGGYGVDRWGNSGGNGGGWGEAGISGGNSGQNGNGPGGGGRAGAFVDGYDYITFITRGTLKGEIKWSGAKIGMTNSSQYQMSNKGINTIYGGAYAISTYVKAGGNIPTGYGSNLLIDDDYWGPLDMKKYGAAGFAWYLYGINIMDNFFLSSNSLISSPGPGFNFGTYTNPLYPVKLFINHRDLQTYQSWVNATSYSTNRAFQIYFGSELYNNAGIYDTKEIIFYNPVYTGGFMVVLIKCGGNGSAGSFAGNGLSAVANKAGDKYYNFDSLMGAGKNVTLIGDPNGDNWQAFNGYLVDVNGNPINN